MKRILVLSNNEIVEWQGAGYIISNTIKSLRNIGYVVDIAPPSYFSFLPKLHEKAVNYRMALGMAIWVLKNKEKLSKYNLLLFYTAESSLALYIIQKIFKFNIPSILHSNGLETHFDITLKKFNEFLNIKNKWYHLNKSWLFNYSYKNVDAIFTLSKFDKEFATTHLSISEEKIHVMEPCLPDIFFNDNTDAMHKKRPIITFCGTWIARKGIEAIKESIPRILRKYPYYTFRIIGPGNNFEIENHFPQDIIDKIEVFYLVEDKLEMIKLYEETSIFLFPSLYESFGMVITEAMFYKCAVICGSTGISADLKNNIEAPILELPNSTNVYNALEELINNEELRKNLGNNARKRAERLCWSNYKIELENKIADIIHN